MAQLLSTELRRARAPDPHADIAAVAARYAVSVTPLMQKMIAEQGGDGPLARQFLPDVRELTRTPEESDDPIDDFRFSPVKGVVHRYPDRVLLKMLHVCPVYCRFCFRREMVGPEGDGMLSPDELTAALGYIASRPEIWEVILTGGDPFMLSARRVAALMAELNKIGHVKVVRWHTRVPVVAPERVTEAFVAALRAPGLTPWVALHANHASEFGPEADAAIARLIDAGVPMVSQSVLLAGVNDTAHDMQGLMRAFVERRIKPYYLHHTDMAPGTGHFRTTVEQGQKLMQALHASSSGLCQPTYVLDVPGQAIKLPLTPDMLSADVLARTAAAL
jgi:lysine 2,3-aminomutase